MEKKSDLRPKGSKVYEKGGWTFGQFLQHSRNSCRRTEQETADLLGISLDYYKDLESDRRYPPTGKLYKKIVKECRIVEQTVPDPDGDDMSVVEATDFGGLCRDDISPDTTEFLRRNWFARLVVDIMEQANIDLMTEQDECHEIQETIYKIAKRKKITIIPPIMDFGDDEGDE